MRRTNARSATQTTRYAGFSGVGAQRYRLLSSAPHDFRVASGAKSWLASSSQDTVEQESGKEHDVVDAEDAIETEARPFPKVGDVVRYEGKWKDDVTFGEVSEPVASALLVGVRKYLGLRCIGQGNGHSVVFSRTANPRWWPWAADSVYRPHIGPRPVTDPDNACIVLY